MGGERSKRAALRQSVNTACQGSCGDALKVGILKLQHYFETELAHYQPRILCPVFDAVLIDISAQAFEVREVVEQSLKEALEVKLKFEGRETRMKCDMHWSKTNWLDAMGKSLTEVFSDL